MLRRLLARLRAWVAVDPPDERIAGSGEVVLDPAYNAAYEGERELQRLADLEDAGEEDADQP